MNGLVREAFKRLIANRNIEHYIEVDDYSDFIFLDKRGYPMVAGNFTSAFKKLVKKYNKKCCNPEMPNITPHGLRHTFCTNMANLGMTPNNLQYIMGHKNITMTLGYYAHGSHISAQIEMNKFFKEDSFTTLQGDILSLFIPNHK